MIESVLLYERVGKYRLGESTEQFNLVLKCEENTALGKKETILSRLFDESVYTDKLLPSEALFLIKEELDSLLYSSHREEDNEKIKYLQTFKDDLDIFFIKRKIDNLKDEILSWERDLSNYY